MTKPVIIITTVGTSVLDSRKHRELTNLAHTSDQNLTAEERQLLQTVEREALARLASHQHDRSLLRRASAELNGFYGALEQMDGSEQASLVHYLVPTDTAVCQVAARVLQTHLANVGMPAQLLQVEGLQVGDRETFERGVTRLLHQLDDIVNTDSTRVIFNLSGGFKVLLVYMGALSMMVGAEFIYIFESQRSDLLPVPRLPISWQVPTVTSRPLLVGSMLRLAYAGRSRDAITLTDKEQPIARDLGGLIVNTVDGGLAHLSPWGVLWWDRVKAEVVKEIGEAGDLPVLPRLQYASEFKSAVKKANLTERLQLFEKLAIVSVLLEDQDGLSRLKQHESLQYSAMKGAGGDHFRITDSRRVMCHRVNGGHETELMLDNYGAHSVED